MGLLPARDEDFELAIESWSETLNDAGIPLNQVAYCFQRAIFEHKGKRNISVAQILEQWNEVKPKNGRINGGECSNPYCHDGWEIGHTKVVDGANYTGVIPCASCAAGEAKRRMIDKGDN